MLTLPSLRIPAEATSPDGLGSLISVPDMGDKSSLFQSVDTSHYGIYTDLGMADVSQNTARVLYEPLMGLAMALVKFAIAAAWWLNRITTTNGVGEAVGAAITSGNATLAAWLMPTALAAGAVIAYAKEKGGQEFFSDLLNICVAGLLMVALATSGQQIVGWMDQGRQLIGASVTAAGAGSVQSLKQPFEWGGDLTGRTPEETLNVRTGDALWRTYAVTPWCVTQFGSLEACKKYGADWLKLNTDDERKEYVNTTIKEAEGGDDAPTVRYMQGHDPAQRVVVSLVSTVMAVGVAWTVGGMPVAALMCWTAALLLMTLGVLWAAMLAVPGPLRRIGAGIYTVILGLTVLSALIGGLLTGALIISAATMGLMQPLGYLPMAIMGLAVIAAAKKCRDIIEAAFTGRTGMASTGGFAMKAAAFMGGRALMREGGRWARGTAKVAGAGARGAYNGAMDRTVAGSVAANSGPRSQRAGGFMARRRGGDEQGGSGGAARRPGPTTGPPSRGGGSGAVATTDGRRRARSARVPAAGSSAQSAQRPSRRPAQRPNTPAADTPSRADRRSGSRRQVGGVTPATSHGRESDGRARTARAGSGPQTSGRAEQPAAPMRDGGESGSRRRGGGSDQPQRATSTRQPAKPTRATREERGARTTSTPSREAQTGAARRGGTWTRSARTSGAPRSGYEASFTRKPVAKDKPKPEQTRYRRRRGA